MNNFSLLVAVAIVAIAALTLAACSDDDAPVITNVTARSVSGNGYLLDGMWKSCFADALGDISEERSISGASITYEDGITYASTTGICTGARTAGVTITGTFVGVATFTSAGWNGGSGLVPAPAALDGVTIIPDKPEATRISLSVLLGGDTPASTQHVAFVDDSNPAMNILWYQGAQGPPAVCDPNNDASHHCLFKLIPLIKQ